MFIGVFQAVTKASETEGALQEIKVNSTTD